MAHPDDLPPRRRRRAALTTSRGWPLLGAMAAAGASWLTLEPRLARPTVLVEMQVLPGHDWKGVYGEAQQVPGLVKSRLDDSAAGSSLQLWYRQGQDWDLSGLSNRLARIPGGEVRAMQALPVSWRADERWWLYGCTLGAGLVGAALGRTWVLARSEQASMPRPGPLPSPPSPIRPASPVTPVPAPPPAPRPATAAEPFVNSLGQRFVPVGPVLFCIWPTRVRDFQKFAQAVGVNTGTDFWSWNPQDKAPKGSDQWKRLGLTWEKQAFEQTDDHPVVGVSWHDSVQFCEWLTEMERKAGLIGPKDRYRLPTDAEWSQAVGPTKYPWGEEWPPSAPVGNYAGEEFDEGWSRIQGYRDGYRRTSPVGSFPANAYGIFDLGGNVWEYIDEWYRADLNSEEARREIPVLADDGGGRKYRVLRGGAWLSGHRLRLESACRGLESPQRRHVGNGFRCVLEREGSA